MSADARSFNEGVITMSLESIVGLIVTALVMVYLVYALLRPEKF